MASNVLTQDVIDALQPRLQVLGSRKEKTREAASFLFFVHKIYPSAAVVHKCTRHGSISDINADLHEFWEHLRKAGRVSLSGIPMPQSLLEAFQSALSEMWRLSAQGAEEALQERQNELQQKEQAARESVLLANQQRDLALTAMSDLKAELSAKERELAQALQENEGLKAENALLAQTVVQWRQKSADEAAARQDAETKYQEALREERAMHRRSADILEGEINFAKMQIEAARAETKEVRDSYRKRDVDHELELSALRQRASKAEDALGQARLELADLKIQLSALHREKEVTKAKPPTMKMLRKPGRVR